MTTPKARFQAKPDAIKRHHDLIDRPELQEAIDVAFQQYVQTQVGGKGDAGTASAAFFCIQGAKEFMETFLHLADKASAAKPFLASNLPGNKP